MKPFNVGMIGYGWAAGAHIDAINATSRAQVTAVYSSRPQDSNDLTAKHGSRITAYQNLDQMLDDPDLHAVSVASYPNLHADQVVKAVRCGQASHHRKAARPKLR
ncbi:MAG: Gfo/Idh/MocA family oxidoreductase [Verrucomicrobiales bacterium]